MEQFKNIIKSMISLFESLEVWEQKKIDAVTKNKIILLEEAMNKEQAEILKLRGMERELYAVQKEHGWEGKTFRQIIPLIPEEEKQEIEGLFRKFSDCIKSFQAVNEEAKKALNIQIYAINKAMQQNGLEYNDSGKIKNRKQSFTNTRV